MSARTLDPLIVEMLRRMPPPNSEWPGPARVRWFRAMTAILDLVYRIDDGTEPSFDVSLTPAAGPHDAPAAGGWEWPDLSGVPGAAFLNIFPQPGQVVALPILFGE